MGKSLIQFLLDVTSSQIAKDDIYENGSKWGESNYWYWNGLRCHWRVLGNENSPPLVFLHGFGASSAHWRNNANPFAAAGFRVYGLDLIGFGESDQPGLEKFSRGLENRLWAKQLEAFLVEVVEVNRFRKAVLVCNSLGSLIAITTVVHRQGLIGAVIAAPLPDPAFMNPFSIAFPKVCLTIKSYLIKLFFNFLPLEILVFFVARTELIKFALQGA